MKQGEIWLINLDPTVGAEIQKTRPAIIVSDNNLGKLPLRVIVPLTDWKDRYLVAPWMIKIVPNSENNLAKISGADCFQVRSVSVSRFVKCIGYIQSSQLQLISIGLQSVFQIS